MLDCFDLLLVDAKNLTDRAILYPGLLETVILSLSQETGAVSVLRGSGVLVGMLGLNDWQMYRLNSW